MLPRMIRVSILLRETAHLNAQQLEQSLAILQLPCQLLHLAQLLLDGRQPLRDLLGLIWILPKLAALGLLLKVCRL